MRNGIWDRSSVPADATVIVKRVEGFSKTAYDDNGKRRGGTWTIGYGATKDARGKRVKASTPDVTEAEAAALLVRDMAGAARGVARRVTVELTERQAAALVSWVYNLGEGNLAKSTLLRRINAGVFTDVPGQMRRWINHEGKPLVGLLRRRWAEAAIFEGLDAERAVTRAWAEIDGLKDWPRF